MPPISILQLEDSDLDAELELACLQRAGIEVQSTRVERRTEFCLALETQTFDVILADFHLPDFNGLDALAWAREKAPRTPFIFVSGMMGEEIAIDSLRNGATDYVMKTRMERLGPAVARAISEQREHAERRRVESALMESESRFRNMADSAPVMIWTADADKSWSYCNLPWLKFTGLTIEQSSGSSWTALVHPVDLPQVLETYDRAFETRQEFAIEFRLRRHDGQYRALINHAVPRFGDQSAFAGFIGSCSDITEMKMAEERLRLAGKLESLGILAGGIAHDFNNLLCLIMGNASFGLESVPPGCPVAECLANIVNASEKAARLTQQMLAYSGKGHFVLEHVDLSLAVRKTLALIETSLPSVLKLDLELAQGLPTIEADLGQMQQLVMSVVINAAEAAVLTFGGSVLISTSVEELSSSGVAIMLAGFPVIPGRYVVLRVHDNGPGMNDEIKASIFDPFFSTKFSGRGLGLAAVSGIVRGHRGGIALATAPGKGADFRVYLPVNGAGRESPVGPGL